ncbi:MAG: helix-turn-helix domain-containing protein [Pseudomonadota bacterium]
MTYRSVRMTHVFFGAAMGVMAISYAAMAWAAQAGPNWLLDARPLLAAALPALIALHIQTGWTKKALPAMQAWRYLALQGAIVGAVALSQWLNPHMTDLLLFLTWAGHALWLALGSPNPSSSPHSAILQHDWLRWRRTLAIWMLVATMIDAAIAIELEIRTNEMAQSRILNLAGLLSILAAGLAMLACLHRHRVVRWLMHAPPRASNDPNVTLGQLEQAMLNSQVFLNPDLTVAQFARRMRIPARSVSQTINLEHGTNFNRWVNRFRIEKSQQLMTEQPHVSLTDLLLESGFQSKSTFNAAFREQTGTSPSVWRKEHIANT